MTPTTMKVLEIRDYKKGWILMKTTVLDWAYSKDTSFKLGEEVELEIKRSNGKWWVNRKEKI